MLTARDFNYRSIIEDKDAALRIASEAATNILLGTLDRELRVGREKGGRGERGVAAGLI